MKSIQSALDVSDPRLDTIIKERIKENRGKNIGGFVRKIFAKCDKFETNGEIHLVFSKKDFRSLFCQKQGKIRKNRIKDGVDLGSPIYE